MQEINQLLLNVAYTLHNSSDFLMKKWLFKYKDMNTEWQKFRIPSDFKTCYFGLISEVQCWRVYFFSGRKSHAVINWYQLYKPETCKVKPIIKVNKNTLFFGDLERLVLCPRSHSWRLETIFPDNSTQSLSKLRLCLQSVLGIFCVKCKREKEESSTTTPGNGGQNFMSKKVKL